MTTFYLIRHGDRERTIGDPPLSAVGTAQARATAAFLRATPLQAVYASPLRRARETAAHIAAPRGLPVVEDARLRERANWGDLPGQTFADFAAMWERGTRDRDFIPPVGDSARQAGARIEAFVQEIALAYPDGQVVAVTHGGVIADFLVNVFAVDELDRWHPEFLAVQSKIVAECSITVVRSDGFRHRLEALAGVQHLP